MLLLCNLRGSGGAVKFSLAFCFKSREVSKFWKSIEKSSLFDWVYYKYNSHRKLPEGPPWSSERPSAVLRSQAFVVISSEETKITSSYILFLVMYRSLLERETVL